MSVFKHKIAVGQRWQQIGVPHLEVVVDKITTSKSAWGGTLEISNGTKTMKRSIDTFLKQYSQ